MLNVVLTSLFHPFIISLVSTATLLHLPRPFVCLSVQPSVRMIQGFVKNFSIILPFLNLSSNEFMVLSFLKIFFSLPKICVLIYANLVMKLITRSKSLYVFNFRFGVKIYKLGLYQEQMLRRRSGPLDNQTNRYNLHRHLQIDDE